MEKPPENFTEPCSRNQTKTPNIDYHQALSLLFTFDSASALYGIPEREAAHLRLKPNTYRLFNTDEFSHRPGSNTALYGSVPYIYGHSSSGG